MPYPYFNSYQVPFSQYQPIQQIQPPQMPQPQQAPQSGFVRVQSEDEARRYPVAPGGSITFIDENSPHCYVKSAGLSQLDTPTFKRFRLVEEAEAPQSTEKGDKSAFRESNIDIKVYAKKADVEALSARYDDMAKEIEKLRFDIDALEEKSTKKMVQKARKDADTE